MGYAVGTETPPGSQGLAPRRLEAKEDGEQVRKRSRRQRGTWRRSEGSRRTHSG